MLRKVDQKTLVKLQCIHDETLCSTIDQVSMNDEKADSAKSMIYEILEPKDKRHAASYSDSNPTEVMAV
jgi:hypothetical protein